MGRFQNLSQVGQVLTDVITAAVPAGTDVVLNVPPENPEAAQAGVRVTLLWTTPQPGHRSDGPQRNPDGTLALPPATVSAWYLISTYGQTPENNAIGAHDLLGEIVRTFHARTTLALPINGNGEGTMDVVQITVDHEMCEKVWVPLQARLRPWAVFDVGPIQLLRRENDVAFQPVVRPGGVNLAGVDVVGQARIERIVPSTIGVGGRVRIDGSYTGTPTRVTIGDVRLEPPDIAPMAPDGPVLVTLTNAVGEGEYTVTLRGTGAAVSEPEVIAVVETTIPSVDAPDVLRHSRASALVLEGRALGVGATEVFFWPDTGINSPSDVIIVTGAAAVTTVTIAPAALAALPPRVYRVSLHRPPHTFTAYVVLEIGP